MNFRLGQKITGYLLEGGPFDGYIISFNPEGPKDKGPLARVKFYSSKGVGTAMLDTCHPMEVANIKHCKDSFLAASTRCSAHLAFKGERERRDFLERFWQELCDFTQKDEP